MRVCAGGEVRPSCSPAPCDATMEVQNERQRPRRPTTGSRKRSSRREGAPRGSRTTGPLTRLGRGQLRKAYQESLVQLELAYACPKIFYDDDGMWLLANSSVLEGLDGKATFLVGLPFASGAAPRAWAFWKSSDGHRWIGPRHTNFMDGSICAFSTEDRVWTVGGSLVSLLDLYSVWVARQLHLTEFGRWPGRQYGPHPFYRLVEFRPGELCGCGASGRCYFDCCRPHDLRYDLAQLHASFRKEFGGELKDRAPPPAVGAFISGTGPIPRLRDVHEGLENVSSRRRVE